MPRIEIIPKERNKNDPTPTIDVCAECALEFEEGSCLSGLVVNMLNDTGVDSCLDIDLDDAEVGSTLVEHPSYDYEDYPCECCGKFLTSEDD